MDGVSYCIVNVSHPYFGRIGQIVDENLDGTYLFKSREKCDTELIIVRYEDIARLA